MRMTEYRNREDAGDVLAKLLQESVKPPCVVVGIPRGGVLVAGPIARRLGCPLTMSFARKLTLPRAPELAFGAVDEDGHAVVDYSLIHDLAAHPEEVSHARESVALEIRRQQRLFSAPRIELFLPESCVLLVDDGLATGYSMRAALAHVRRHGARQVVVAVPCASASASQAIQREADEFVCPWVDEAFVAVGAYYLDYQPVTDEEVLAVLNQARDRSGEPTEKADSRART